MLKTIFSLWIFIPILSGVYQLGMAYIVQPPVSITQLAQDTQNSQTFNALVQLAVGSILTALLLRIQRNQRKTTQEVKSVALDTAPKQDFEALQRQVKELESALALTNIQKRQVEIAEEQSRTTQAIRELLTDFGHRQDIIMDTQTRIDQKIGMVAGNMEQVRDIAVAAADQGATYQDATLKELLRIEESIKVSIAGLKDVIEKRKTTGGDSSPFPVVSPEEINKPVQMVNKEISNG